eukprot:gene24862-30041_t
MNETDAEVIASHAESMSSLAQELEGQVKNLIKTHGRVPKNVWESMTAFSYAIDWRENFIRALIATHVVILVTVLLTRKNIELQFAILCLISLTVYFSERINSYAGLHWREFASQNYFDQHGVFCGLFLAAPLLLIAFIQLINLLAQASSALITAKRMQIKRKLEKAKKEAASKAEDSGDNAEQSSISDSKKESE